MITDQMSMGDVFQTSCAKVISSPWRVSMVFAFQSENAFSFTLTLEMEVFWPTLVNSTRLRVR